MAQSDADKAMIKAPADEKRRITAVLAGQSPGLTFNITNTSSTSPTQVPPSPPPSTSEPAALEWSEAMAKAMEGVHALPGDRRAAFWLEIAKEIRAMEEMQGRRIEMIRQELLDARTKSRDSNEDGSSAFDAPIT